MYCYSEKMKPRPHSEGEAKSYILKKKEHHMFLF